MINRVFVYGTLKEGRPLDRKMFKELRKKVTEATTEGTIYNLGRFPGVRLDEEGIVHGEVHEFDKKDIKVVIQIMDGIEGYSPERDEKSNFYNRRVITATTKDGKKLKAYIYEFGRKIKDHKLEDGVWEPGK